MTAVKSSKLVCTGITDRVRIETRHNQSSLLGSLEQDHFTKKYFAAASECYDCDHYSDY